MRVFHGTSQDSARLILADGPILKFRNYTKRRSRCFSTTTDFFIARLFALRRSPVEAIKDESLVGVVLEYDLSGEEGVDWGHARDANVLQDEKEIVVFNPACLIFKKTITFAPETMHT